MEINLRECYLESEKLRKAAIYVGLAIAGAGAMYLLYDNFLRKEEPVHKKIYDDRQFMQLCDRRQDD